MDDDYGVVTLGALLLILFVGFSIFTWVYFFTNEQIINSPPWKCTHHSGYDCEQWTYEGKAK